MIEWTSTKIAELIDLLRGAAVLLAIAMVGYSYAKTRSLVTLLVAALTAGFFLWTINNTDWWEQKVGEESGLAPVPGALDPYSSAEEPAGLVIGGLR